MRNRRILTQTLAVAVSVVMVGCSTTRYKNLADEEVYGILDEKSPYVPGLVQDFDIEPPAEFVLAGLPINEEAEDWLGPEAASEVGAAIVSLEKALEIAFTHSREYQTRKEQLYLVALALTLDRHEFDPIFFASGDVTHTWTFSEELVGSSSMASFQESLDTLTGPAAKLFQDYAEITESAGPVAKQSVDIDGEQVLSANTNVGVDMLLKGGGRIALNLTSNFFRFLVGNGSDSATSALVASFTQPLLRGAGSDVFAEFLTQSERNVLYELRSFTRFRKQFAVRIASSYYSVLRNKNTIYNNALGLDASRRSLEREEAFMEEGLRTPGEVGRLREDVLRREEQLTDSIVNYKQSLDNFKILLGLPIETSMILDEDELTTIAEEGVTTPDLREQEAITIALATRLDLYTQRDQVFDSHRRIRVAANAFMPDMNLIVETIVPSEDGNRFLSADFDRQEWSAGLDLDLNLDKKAERNNYRRALIDFEVSRREFQEREDVVKLEVRDAFRALQQAETNYQINLSSLELSQRRVEEEELRSELNLGNILDLVDAQNALTAAQTALTNAIVNHRIALLEFYRDIGILYVKENGQWEELRDA